MAANLPRPPVDENTSTTLSSGITDIATQMDVADASKIVAPCYLAIDRVDASGTLKSTAFWEYVKVTNVASNTLTITRAQSGSTGQSHSAGAVVEAVVTSAMFEDWYNALNADHAVNGGHVMGTATVNYTETHNLVVTSVASINQFNATNLIFTTLNTSGASIINFLGSGLNPVWRFAGAFSGATTYLDPPLVTPQPGNWSYFTFVTRTVASGVSAIIDIKKNGSSIFDTIGRPMIAAGGTFVSTASIKTKAFASGDQFIIDYAGTGGLITDIKIQGRGV